MIRKSNFKRIIAAVLAVSITGALVLSSCSKDDDNGGNNTIDQGKGYLLWITPDGNGGEQAYQIINDVNSGEYSVTDAIETTNVPRYRDPNGSGKIYLDYNYTEYEVTDEGRIAEKRTIKDANGNVMGGGTHRASNGQILGLSGSTEAVGENEFKVNVDVIDEERFTILRSGTVTVPVPEGNAIWPNSVALHGDKIVFTYFLHDPVTYVANDTACAVIMDFNTMEQITIAKDTRTSALGFAYDDCVSYNGNLYLSTSNSDYWGINESKPAGILRINQGDNAFDQNYFLNITALTGNHNISLKYVGNGKAITTVFRKDLIVDYSDYDAAYVIEHWLLDLEAQTGVKLDIPLSKGSQIQIVDIGNNQYAIPANTVNGSYFYIYNSSTGSLTQGAKYVGGSFNRTFIKLQ